MSKEQVKDRLIEAGTRDQEIRRKIVKEGDSEELYAEMGKIDAENKIFIKEVIKDFGLIKISEFGEEAYKYAFLMVQHLTEEDVDFMEKYLELMKNNIEDVKKSHIALIQDRVLMYKGKPQIYGTQLIRKNDSEKYELYEVSDYDHINERRAELGLETIEEYLEDMI